MAISWDVSIKEKDNSGNFNMSAIVTDDSKPIKYQVEPASITGRMDNQAQKEGLFDALKQNYLDKVGDTIDMATIEIEAKTYLEK